MATIDTQTIDTDLTRLGNEVAELSIPLAHARAAYDQIQSAANWRAVDRAQAIWRSAVLRYEMCRLNLEADGDDDPNPSF